MLFTHPRPALLKSMTDSVLWLSCGLLLEDDSYRTFQGTFEGCGNDVWVEFGARVETPSKACERLSTTGPRRVSMLRRPFATVEKGREQCVTEQG